MVSVLFYRDHLNVVVLVGMVLFLFSPQPTAASEPNPRRSYRAGDISIGGLFPVHVRGCSDSKFRSDLMSLAEAMVFAIEEINKDSTLLPNISLGYDISDTCLENRLAMESTLDYVNVHKFATSIDKDNETCSQLPAGQLSPVVAVVGTGNSGSSIRVSSLLEVKDIPLVSYAATSDELSKSAYPSFFRTVPPDRFQSKVMADIARYFNWTYVGAIAADDAYGRSGIEHFKKSSKPLGICMAYENYFPPKNGAEKIKSVLEDLKKRPEITVIILYCVSSSAKVVLEEALKQELLGRTWIASEAWGNHPAVIQEPNLQPVLTGMLGVVFTDIPVPAYEEYLLQLTSAHRPASWWTFFWEEQFDCTFNITRRDGKKQCSDNLKITKTIQAENLSDSKAAYVINAVYAIAHALDDILKNRSSQQQAVRSPQTEPHIEPQDVLKYLRKKNFTSPVSRVSFDENGDSFASYSIVNYQHVQGGSGRAVIVGTWEQQALNLRTSGIVWNGGRAGDIPRSVCSETCPAGYRQTVELNCCWQCIKCPTDHITSRPGEINCTRCHEDEISNDAHTKCLTVPVVRILWGDPEAVFIVFISFTGVIGTLFVGLVFMRRNESPIVKASNRELSYLCLFCITMCYLWAVVNLSEPSYFTCPLNQAWFYIFYSVAIAVLGVKTKKIVHLFQNRVPRSELTTSFVQKHKYSLLIVSVVVFDLLILTIWFATDTPVPNLDRSLRTEYFLHCESSSTVPGKFCQYLLVAFLVAISFTCCYFAFKARKLPHNFNEGKFIAFALYILSVSWVTFYPVYLNIRGKYTVVVSCSASIIAATGLLVCIYVPKIYIILLHPEKNTVAYMKSQITSHTFRQSAAATGDSTRPSNNPDTNPGGTRDPSRESQTPNIDHNAI